MGARISDSSTIKSPAFKKENENFANECFAFFEKQIEFQKRKLIIVLGVAVANFLGKFIPELGYYKKSNSLKKIDEDGMAFRTDINYFQKFGMKTNFVILQHPSFSELNIKHRTYKDFEKGETACIELLKEAVKISFI